MKTAMIVGMLALAGLGAREGQGAENFDYQVRVYLENQQLANTYILLRAEAIATGMFARIGVRVRWELGSPRDPAADIVLRLATHEHDNSHGDALGYALPYAQSGVRVTLYCDGMLRPAVGNEGAASVLLAHTLAHEITHVLQGLVRHSEEGVMKAQWTAEDRARMQQKPLLFTDYDVALIRLAMTSRQDTAKGTAQVVRR